MPKENNALQSLKKKWEFSKADVHLPELNYSHLPELKGVDGKDLWMVLECL